MKIIAYADSMKPFQYSKYGRSARLDHTNQYAGEEKWEAQIKKQNELLHTRNRTGQSNFTLERFIQHHRNAYIFMQDCA